MLELKHVTKEYTVGNLTVRALDDVSVEFGDSGMVFLLGKSGSGKSTMLNVSGGLDAADSGEVIVKGRSSKDFSEADFDSYRNTFVGFIFQEYNVLEEFSVEENVQLALELQNRSADRDKVEEILKKVELDGLGKRKPNTLSGGQKQRVAIARALVKDPEIIMADEPTGALDSATGKQVFDTLKRLSKDKLVIVVSHDREFAEQYADRIIELMDGKIVSDVSRVGASEGEWKENLVRLGEHTLSIKRGDRLTDAEIGRITDFLRERSTDFVITCDPKEVGSFRRERSATSGEFVTTEAEHLRMKRYDGKDTKFIRSHLPVRHASRLGLSSLKIKPVRLAFTVLLSTVAFVMFGLLSTLMLFSKTTVAVAAIAEHPHIGVAVQKLYDRHYYRPDGTRFVISDNRGQMTQSDIDEMNETYSAASFIGLYCFGKPALSFAEWLGPQKNSLNAYYSGRTSARGFFEGTPSDFEQAGYRLLQGSWPTEPEEIAIPTFLYEVFVECGYMGDADFFPEPLEEGTSSLLGHRILFNGAAVPFSLKLVGIVDCGSLPEELAMLKDYRYITYYNTPHYSELLKLQETMNDLMRNSLHQVFLAGKGTFYQKYARDWFEEVGVVGGDDSYETTYVSPDFDREKEANSPIYDWAYTTLPKHPKSLLKQLVSVHNVRPKGEDVYLSLQNTVLGDVGDADAVIAVMERVVLISGSVLGVFAALLLFNFITVSIHQKEKEIGILRAVGARGIDVFKIFFTESLFITLACFLLACIVTPIVVALVNAYLIKNLGLGFRLLFFTPIDIGIILLVSLLIATISTIFPVRSAAKRKPVDVIRAL